MTVEAVNYRRLVRASVGFVGRKVEQVPVGKTDMYCAGVWRPHARIEVKIS